MIVSSGEDEHVEMINAKFIEIFGYTLEDMPDVAHWWPLAYPDEKYREEVKVRWQERVKMAIKTKCQIEPLEATARCKDGSYRYVEFRLSSIRDWHLVTFVDLTEHKRVEEKVRKSAEEIQDLYDHAPCGHHSLDNQGIIIRINDTELQWLGYRRDEVVGKMKLTDLIAEKGLQTFQEKFQLFKQQGQINDLEFEMIRKDGTLLSVLLSATAIYDEAENFLMSRSTLYDITERKRAENALHASENRFRVLSDNAFVGIYIIQDGRLSYVNSTLAKMFGYTTEELTGAQPALVIHPEDQALVSENIRRRIDGEMEKIHYEFRGRCKNGEIINIEVLGGRVDFGGKTAIIGNLVDITERKRAENALHERELHSQSLLRISKSLEQAQTYTEVLETCRSEVRKMIGYQNLWVYLLSEDEKYFKSLIAGGEISDSVLSEEGTTATLSIQGDRMLEEIAAARDIVIVEDAQQDERVNKEIITKLGNRTIINVPISLFDRHLGSVGMGTFGEEGVRIPSKSEREYLMSMASHLAVSLDRIHLLNKRRQMEQELITREQAYRLLVENIPDLIVRYDRELRRVYVNPAWERSSRVSAAEAINRHPIDTPKISNSANKEYLEKLQQVLTTGVSQSIEFKWVNALGETLLLEYFIVPEYDQSGNINGVLSVGRDITERKRMEDALAAREREFRTLAENSPDNIARYDIHGQTLYVNPTLEKTLKHTASEMLDTFPATAGFIKEASEYQEKIIDVIKTGKEQEIDLVLPDSEKGTRYHNVRFVAERGDDGTITGVLAIGRDITERKRHELEHQAIINVSTALRQAITRTETLDVILKQLETLFETDGVVLVLPNSQNQELVDELGCGPIGEKMKGLVIPPGKGLCNWVIANKNPI